MAGVWLAIVFIAARGGRVAADPDINDIDAAQFNALQNNYLFSANANEPIKDEDNIYAEMERVLALKAKKDLIYELGIDITRCKRFLVEKKLTTGKPVLTLYLLQTNKYVPATETDNYGDIAPVGKSTFGLNLTQDEVHLRTLDPECRVKTTRNTNVDATALFELGVKRSPVDKSCMAKPQHEYFTDSSKVAEPERDNGWFDEKDNKAELATQHFTTDCYSECNFGKLIIFDMKEKSAQWQQKLLLNETCEWFKVCLDLKKETNENVIPKCTTYKAAEFSLLFGFAVMPNQAEAITLNMKAGNGYEVDVQYNGRLIVTTPHHEQAVSSEFITSERIAFSFSDEQCLLDKITGLSNGKIFTAENNGEKKPTQKYNPPATPAPIIVATVTEATKASRETTTTPPPTLAETTTHTTQAQVAVVTRSAEDLAISYAQRQEELYGKGWLTWAVFYGFTAGSLVSYLLGGLILFFMKRSLYVFWYREMYNRYGSDATTAGATVTESVMTSVTTTTGGVTTTDGATTEGATTESILRA